MFAVVDIWRAFRAASSLMVPHSFALIKRVEKVKRICFRGIEGDDYASGYNRFMAG
jgi:hypothetical protein